MTFAQKLKTMRKQADLSQEKLAEKLGVSRQAITKWETDAGIPDIGNIKAICALFGISMDDLFSDESTAINNTDYIYESVTEYDIDGIKRFDIKLGCANTVIVEGADSEKLRVRLASNTLATLQSDLKVKIDDIKNRIDVDISRKNTLTQAVTKQSLVVFIHIPTKYIGKIELTLNCEKLELHSLESDSIELDVKTKSLMLNEVKGNIEIDCNLDMDIVCETLCGEIAINQISACSKIRVPKDTSFTAIAKGIATSISYEKDGKPTPPFAADEADNMIELNGIKSELVIYSE